MTVSIPNVNINLHNFQFWYDRTNDIINALGTVVLSANSITSGNSGVTGKFQADNLTTNTANVTTANVITLYANTGTVNTGTITNLTSTTGTVTNLTSTTGKITTANVITLYANTGTVNTGTITNLTSTTGTITNLTSTTGNVVTLTSNTATVNTGTITNLTSTTATIGAGTLTVGNVVTLTSNTATVNTGTITNLTSTTGKITTANVTTANVITLYANTGTITNLTSTTGTITNLTSTTGTVTNLTSTTATIGTLAGTAATGTGASGTWGINVTGSSYVASRLAMGGNTTNAALFNYSGQTGQPTWLWGSIDSSNHAVYNPVNFNVNNAVTVNGYNVNQNLRTTDNVAFAKVSIDTLTELDSFTTTVNSLTLSPIDSFIFATYRSGEYVLDIKDNNANNIVHTRLAVMHSGGTPYSVEYATLISNTQIGTLTATSNATHCILNYQSAVSNNVTIKCYKQLMLT